MNYRFFAPVLLLMATACTSDRIWDHTPTASEIIDYSAKQRAEGNIPGVVKIGKPYSVNGMTYTPRYQPDYEEEGVASWYGPGFHGEKTAHGEQYNKHDFTAAHTTLPLPSMVRVTHLDNDRSIIARVNDRGPFARGRVIDLSKSAAEALDMIGTGTARVRVEYLENETRELWSRLAMKEPREVLVAEGRDQPTVSDAPVASVRVMETPPPAMPRVTEEEELLASKQLEEWGARVAEEATPQAGLPAHGKLLQVGSYQSRHNADQAAYRLAGHGTSRVEAVTVGGKNLWRVTVAPKMGVTMEQLKADVAAAGYADARVVGQ